VLSPSVRIDEGIKIDMTILLPGVCVGKGARIRRAVEEGVELPAGFTVGFDVEHDGKHYTVTEADVIVISQTPNNRKPISLPLVFNCAKMRTAKRLPADAVRATA
jgi:ADP-glucose pyrophosphorylase